MKCPFCLIEYHDKPTEIANYKDADGIWEIILRTCSACKRSNLTLENISYLPPTSLTQSHERIIHSSVLIYPHRASRPPCPSQVPEHFSDDYNEACLIISDSPKASAALSRRCLQNILRECANVVHRDLSKEIQEILDRKILPSHLSESLDAVRNIGNFAAHPVKSNSTGEIASVELGEAEWCLDVIESLFDYYFVQPANMAMKKAALDKKLADAGKPPMKVK